MTDFAPVRRIATIVFVLFSIILTLQSCRKKRSEEATFFFKNTHNKIYKGYTPEGFASVFKQELAKNKTKIRHADFIIDHYNKDHLKPELVMAHLFNNELYTMDSYYFKADEHGLTPDMFQADKLRMLINQFNSKTEIKNINDAYRVIAQIELTAANSLIYYTNALQYGVVNPKNIYRRYFEITKRPDSLSMGRIFSINNMQAYLDSIQPKVPGYHELQQALRDGYTSAGISQEETRRILQVNLERLRWRNKPSEGKYVIVNIPDFNLNVIDSGHSVLKMRVCVGQGRNMTNANTLTAYNDTCKDDKPGDHETPLLNSLIHSVDVNPIWNIPKSIANKEILVEAGKDRFYLANKNINVYQNGKLIEDPEDIDWTKVTKDNSDYDFKQNPGEDNSLGKIKFLFNNESSVYLHDTPVKSAFSWKMRAVSHGCVRLGEPQKLALNLFGPGEKYDTIVTDMAADNPNPTTIYLPKKVPVYITYVTCWPEDGKLQFRNDVYGHDIVLYDHLQKFLHPAVN